MARPKITLFKGAENAIKKMILVYRKESRIHIVFCSRNKIFLLQNRLVERDVAKPDQRVMQQVLYSHGLKLIFITGTGYKNVPFPPCCQSFLH